MRTSRTRSTSSPRTSTVAPSDDEKVIVGKTKFRAIHADSNALWLVTAARGRGTYDCVIVKEGEFSDYAGVEKVFGAEEIIRSIRMEKFWNRTANDSDAWYESLPVGSTIHYSNGFKQYVRCEVVMGKTVHTGDNIVKCLKPVALVGEWREYDLPRRLPTGEVVKGYHAEMIEKGETFRPHATSNFEHPQSGTRVAGIDPRAMKPLNLTLPAATAEDEKKIRLNKAVAAVNEAARTSATPEETLRKIIALATEALAKG